MTGRLGTLWALIHRDLRGLFRRPSRVIAVIGTPLLVWGFLASGFSSGEVLGKGESFTGFLLPGMALLLVVLASMMGAISLIQDRQEGILPALMTSPTDRWLLAVARILSSSVIAMLQAMVMIPLVPLTGGTITPLGLLAGLTVLLLVCVMISGFSLIMAWRIDSIAGFHGVMNLILMPLWMLSGSVAPASSSSGLLLPIIEWNPLGAAAGLLRSAFGLPEPRSDPLAWVLTVGFAALAFVLVVRVFGKESKSPRAPGERAKRHR
ncbi:MAG: ABC-2 type transport system permease protein [Phycisphaerales bacterium]|jgi:ABC-2 type transport system permease protein